MKGQAEIAGFTSDEDIANWITVSAALTAHAEVFLADDYVTFSLSELLPKSFGAEKM